ncbi:hypothetical protein [Halobacillus sp. A5]|nr:hypothetical protein [Halobacillus sp. A5]MCP3026419.1 hypothetical protein [Halobacillus sp. A5]
MNQSDYHLAQLSEADRDKLTSLEKEMGKILIAWENEHSPEGETKNH